ncbi:hypothetical protein FROZEN_57 [Erwinia phage vB_EamP_Frozen]|uniref:Uncharacterized protein n=2 Tax=Johnsonvirus frozen TaxID=1982578 RepID=A0A191ZD20_9CAUD|nr:hypothetical protein FROZEN_57 [Erwinia phage vB_EamP_Frozen]ANJ65186.1 hypothetical protein FROZEN_57 [Erwinia phage vB_EamP_Frozen]ANJ65284.1 hypothetical protein REXELLA_56 [Erwinia phage vB_EamP_Rexella]
MMRRVPFLGSRSFTSSNSFSRRVGTVLPVFTTQPVTQSLFQENGQLLITGAVVRNASSYQWQRSTDGVTFTDVAGQTAAVLNQAGVTGGSATYRLKAINDKGFTYSNNVQVLSAYLWIQNDSSSADGSALGTTKVTNSTYTFNAPAGNRPFSAFYRLLSDNSIFIPEGTTSGRAVPTWVSSNTAVLPQTPVTATGQLNCATKVGSATLTASIGRLSSVMSATIT